MRTGKRASVLSQLLQRAGLKPAPSAAAPPRLNDLPPPSAEELVELYRKLGGRDDAPTLRPGGWDLAFADDLVVELDEELHFNRYRALTLAAPWAAKLPWTAAYLRYCKAYERECLSAGTWGKRWTSPSCERMFGPAGQPGDLASAGAPRWKQRALYDAMKDAAAAAGASRLARLSVHDVIDGKRLGDALEGYGDVPAAAVVALVEERTAAAA